MRLVARLRVRRNVRGTASMTAAEMVGGEGQRCVRADTVRSCEVVHASARLQQLAIMLPSAHERDDQAWLNRSFQGANCATRYDIAQGPSAFGPQRRNSLRMNTRNRRQCMRCGFPNQAMVRRPLCDGSGYCGTGQLIPRAGVRWLVDPHLMAADWMADERGTTRWIPTGRRGAALGTHL